jgi:hypothetical protein
MNIAVNTSYPGAVKQERNRRSSVARESGTLTLAGIGGTLQYIGGVASTTNVPPHSLKCSAGAPTEWHFNSGHQIQFRSVIQKSSIFKPQNCESRAIKALPI